MATKRRLVPNRLSNGKWSTLTCVHISNTKWTQQVVYVCVHTCEYVCVYVYIYIYLYTCMCIEEVRMLRGRGMGVFGGSKNDVNIVPIYEIIKK